MSAWTGPPGNAGGGPPREAASTAQNAAAAAKKLQVPDQYPRRPDSARLAAP